MNGLDVLMARRLSRGARRLLIAWLGLAVTAMLISLVYALLLIFSRSGLSALPGDDAFHVALVSHVNFSLYVWFMSIAALIWNCVLADRRATRWPDWLALALAAGGGALLAVAPWLGAGAALMSDYLPVLDTPVFHAGLALFTLGVSLVALRMPWSAAVIRSRQGIAVIGGVARASALIHLLAMLTLVSCAMRLPAGLDPESRMRQLFWGAGHLLQLHHLLLLLFCWWLLSPLSTLSARAGERLAWLATALLALAFVGTLITLVPSLAVERSAAYTWIMEAGGTAGIAWALVGVRWRSTRDGGFVGVRGLAGLLFAAGCLAGFLIRRDDAMVPAHYHGIIGAVTLTYMYFVLRLLERLGYRSAATRGQGLQGLAYALGMLLMMAGLVMADVPRKMVESDMPAETHEIWGRALTGAGGCLALLGSLLFVMLVCRAFLAMASAEPVTLDEANGQVY
ncbi:MAG TPA: hypothetical protein ENK26_03695 [Gammaproteobacteria bacterium]|nr:hypothetical protein [Gammaproteobacteria bacterium]